MLWVAFEWVLGLPLWRDEVLWRIVESDLALRGYAAGALLQVLLLVGRGVVVAFALVGGERVGVGVEGGVLLWAVRGAGVEGGSVAKAEGIEAGVGGGRSAPRVLRLVVLLWIVIVAWISKHGVL